MKILFYIILGILVMQPVNAAIDAYVDGFSSAANTGAAVAMLLILAIIRKKIDFPTVTLFLHITVVFFILSIQIVTLDQELRSSMAYLARIVFTLIFYVVGLSLAQNNNEYIEKRIIGAAVLILMIVVSLQVVGKLIDFRPPSVAAFFETYYTFAYAKAFVGIAKHPAITATLLLAVLPVLFYRALQGKPFLLMIVSIATIATFRRSSWLVLAVFLLFYLLYYLIHIRPLLKNLILVIVGVIFLVLLWYVLPAEITGPVLERALSEQGNLNSFGSGRLVFWSIILNAFANADEIRILLGHGIGSVSRLLLLNFNLAIGSHNDLLDIVYSLGLIAGLSFCLLWLSFGLAAMQRIQDRKKIYTVWALLIGNVVLSMTTGGVLEPQLAYSYFFLGWLMGSNNGGRNVNVN